MCSGRGSGSRAMRRRSWIPRPGDGVVTPSRVVTPASSHTLPRPGSCRCAWPDRPRSPRPRMHKKRRISSLRLASARAANAQPERNRGGVKKLCCAGCSAEMLIIRGEREANTMDVAEPPRIHQTHESPSGSYRTVSSTPLWPAEREHADVGDYMGRARGQRHARHAMSNAARLMSRDIATCGQDPRPCGFVPARDGTPASRGHLIAVLTSRPRHSML
jgi:hypothetical protein